MESSEIKARTLPLLTTFTVVKIGSVQALYEMLKEQNLLKHFKIMKFPSKILLNEFDKKRKYFPPSTLNAYVLQARVKWKIFSSLLKWKFPERAQVLQVVIFSMCTMLRIEHNLLLKWWKKISAFHCKMFPKHKQLVFNLWKGDGKLTF